MDWRHVGVVFTQTEAHEHRVSLLLAGHVVAVDEVGATLYHALVDEFLERLFLARHAVVVEELVPEARIDEVTGGMLGAADVEIDVLPVVVGLAAHQCLIVVRVHIAQVVGARTGEARHSAQLQREHSFVVDCSTIDNGTGGGVPGPLLGVAQWRLSVFRRLVLAHLGQLQGQAFLGNHVGHSVLVVDGERLAPVALTREDGVAQAVVHLHVAQLLLRDVFFCFLNGFFHGQSVERELAVRAVHHDALLRVEALFRHVGALDERHDGQVEMLGEGIVARVVGRNGHDGARSVACQHVFGNPDRNLLARQRVDGIGT